MRKVMIADDENWIRIGLIGLIPWERFGLELAGEAEDGETAFAMALECRPDIMFIDMRMPGWDGRQLLRELEHALPDTLAIVVSGYSDFEYTKEAIRHRAFEYLLKPVKLEELVDVLAKAEEELERRRLRQAGGAAAGGSANAAAEGSAGAAGDACPPQSESGANGGQGQDIVQEALRLIETDYRQPLSLHHFAESRYLSPDYFGRLFKRMTGQTFVDYVTDRRIAKSKELMKSADYKNYEIATMVGYDDYRYFSQVFKRRTGMTIGDYRSGLLPGAKEERAR